MQKISDWGLESDPLFGRRRVWAFDLDDTLTEHGCISEEVLRRLEWLQAEGHYVTLVTGRPAPWAQIFAKVFPFDAAVAENGAVFFYWPNGKKQRCANEEPASKYWTDKGYVSADDFLKHRESIQNIQMKQKVQDEVFKKFSRLKLASDQVFRLYDLAIDFAEAIVPPLDLSEAQQVKSIFEFYGAVAKVSSIHVNGWWGDFDKRLGLTTLFQSLNWSSTISDVIYFGDSPNDAPLFEFAPISIGVANLHNFESDKSWFRPKFITDKNSGQGVCQAIDHYFDKGSQHE